MPALPPTPFEFNASNACDYRLHPDACHLWRIDLTLEDRDAAAALLSEQELERAQRFTSADQALAFIRAHAALRRILSRYCKQEPRQLQFSISPHGRPELAPRTTIDPVTQLTFNLSHSGSRALLAVSLGSMLGVDIEQVRLVRDPEALAMRHFTASERAALPEPQDTRFTQAFLRIWTRKEAILKSTGLGLNVAPVSVDTQPANTQALIDFRMPDGSATRLRVVSFEPDTGYYGAVAARAPVSRYQGWQYLPASG